MITALGSNFLPPAQMPANREFVCVYVFDNVMY